MSNKENYYAAVLNQMYNDKFYCGKINIVDVGRNASRKWREPSFTMTAAKWELIMDRILKFRK